MRVTFFLLFLQLHYKPKSIFSKFKDYGSIFSSRLHSQYHILLNLQTLGWTQNGMTLMAAIIRTAKNLSFYDQVFFLQPSLMK